MRQVVQVQMLVKSENRIRGVKPMGLHGRHKGQRTKVSDLFTANLVKPPKMNNGVPNKFVITLCRISAGILDKEDNLTGAFKHIKDAVARWLGFKDDSNHSLRWRYQQQTCSRGWHAIRVTIEDVSIGEERLFVFGDSPPVLGPIWENGVRDGSPIVGKNGARTQEGLVFKRSFAALPWDETEGTKGIVATELLDLAQVHSPPEKLPIRIPVGHVHATMKRFGASVSGHGPGAGQTLLFERYDHADSALGGACWLYMPVEYEPDDAESADDAKT